MRQSLCFALLILGCAEMKVASVSPQSAPPAASTTAPTSGTPLQTKPDSEQQVLAVVPPAPAECSGYTQHTATASAGCGDKSEALVAFDKALSENDALTRDAGLAQLANCKVVELGLSLALRAEYAPPACGDALIGEFADANKSKLNPALYDAFIGLKLAAALTRLVRTAPQMEKPYSKERVDAFVKGVMAQWAFEQANAISALSLRGARLSGYGKGLVAVEAGMADMRFVNAFRQVAIPDEFASDPELTEAYYSALDQGLEPRKARGRDAALVGLRIFSDIGVLVDARVDRARELLSKLFNGRRIDAFDDLLVPALPAPELNGIEQRVATKLPTFYVEFVLGSVDPSNATLLRALLERGLPTTLRGKLERSVLSAESRHLYARALFERGRIYWRASDFSAAASIAVTRKTGIVENTFIVALSHALEKGPPDAAAMMLGRTQLNELGDLSQLESLAEGKTPLAALAAYDAALIRQLGSSEDSNADFFKDLARRYERAANLLKDPLQKRLAKQRAAAAAETAKQLH